MIRGLAQWQTGTVRPLACGRGSIPRRIIGIGGVASARRNTPAEVRKKASILRLCNRPDALTCTCRVSERGK